VLLLTVMTKFLPDVGKMNHCPVKPGEVNMHQCDFSNLRVDINEEVKWGVVVRRGDNSSWKRRRGAESDVGFTSYIWSVGRVVGKG
jgi:hypothetical protein